MRPVLVFLLPALSLTLLGCAGSAVSVKGLVGMEAVEVNYLSDDGRWVPEDSLSWLDRPCYRELRYDTDGDGEWNYLYAEVYDDIAGWTWIPSTARVNPEEEPDLARTKKYLVRETKVPPHRPSIDDFGYARQ